MGSLPTHLAQLLLFFGRCMVRRVCVFPYVLVSSLLLCYSSLAKNKLSQEGFSFSYGSAL